MSNQNPSPKALEPDCIPADYSESKMGSPNTDNMVVKQDEHISETSIEDIEQGVEANVYVDIKNYGNEAIMSDDAFIEDDIEAISDPLEDPLKTVQNKTPCVSKDEMSSGEDEGSEPCADQIKDDLDDDEDDQIKDKLDDDEDESDSLTNGEQRILFKEEMMIVEPEIDFEISSDTRHLKTEEIDTEPEEQRVEVIEIAVKPEDLILEVSETTKKESLKPHPCKMCSRRFKLKSSLINHMNKHRGIMFGCKQCNKSFTSKFMAQAHTLAAHEGVRFYCNLCPNYFSYKHTLRTHLQNHNGVRYRCDICFRDFAQTSHLKMHMTTHSTERYLCTVCMKSFSNEVYLKKHKLLHTGFSYGCELCPKTFALKSTLRDHITIHRKERSFTCTICSKKFARRSVLTAHMQLHAGVRYKCDQCPKDFSRKQHLNDHVRVIHEGVRKYPCKLCPKAYGQFTGLTKHMKVQHEITSVAQNSDEEGAPTS